MQQAVNRMTDEQLANIKDMARRDDWHVHFVGSDLRMLIAELERERKRAGTTDPIHVSPHCIIEYGEEPDVHRWRVTGVYLGPVGTESLVELVNITHKPGGKSSTKETIHTMLVPEVLVRHCKIVCKSNSSFEVVERLRHFHPRPTIDFFTGDIKSGERVLVSGEAIRLGLWRLKVNALLDQ